MWKDIPKKTPFRNGNSFGELQNIVNCIVTLEGGKSNEDFLRRRN